MRERWLRQAQKEYAEEQRRQTPFLLPRFTLARPDTPTVDRH